VADQLLPASTALPTVRSHAHAVAKDRGHVRAATAAARLDGPETMKKFFELKKNRPDEYRKCILQYRDEFDTY
jgi:hypothetical protein